MKSLSPIEREIVEILDHRQDKNAAEYTVIMQSVMWYMDRRRQDRSGAVVENHDEAGKALET